MTTTTATNFRSNVKKYLDLVINDSQEVIISRGSESAVLIPLDQFNSIKETELVAAMAENAGLSKKDAEKALNAFKDVVTAELKKGGKVQFVGFGTFEVSKRAAREGRNPQTGKTMKIKASKAPKFKAGKALKDAVN